MGSWDKHQANVGRAQGANVLFIKEGGYFDVGDNSTTAGSQFSGAELKRMLLSPVTRTSYTLASAIQTTSIIPAEYGVVNMTYPSATTSCKLPAANKGAQLFLVINTLSTMSILPGTSGSLALGVSDMSCLHISATATSIITLQLNCVTNNEWQVAEIPSTAVATLQRSS